MLGSEACLLYIVLNMGKLPYKWAAEVYSLLKAEDYTFHMCLVILGITIICKLEFMESAPRRDFSLAVVPLVDGLLEHSSTQMGFKSRTILS